MQQLLSDSEAFRFRSLYTFRNVLSRTVLVPFRLRVAVEVNRPCLGRHPISQRADLLTKGLGPRQHAKAQDTNDRYVE